MISRYNYYQDLKRAARFIRKKYKIDSPRVLPNNLKKILISEGVHYIDLRENLNNARGVYINDEYGINILIKKNMPQDPYAFTLAHELKHHLFDSNLKTILCTDSNINEIVEIGAEVFAAEFLFPEQDFCNLLDDIIGIKRKCTPRDLVILKNISKTTLSYAGISKRAIYRKYLNKVDVKDISWKQLEEQIYGTPFYKKKYTNKRKYRSKMKYRYSI